ncbi:MAG TPA: hypothetical protein VK130_07605 [Steroidobacteraceae bacterium]|nr:hypothetical protein [Steroidobacteraceae bacterium]
MNNIAPSPFAWLDRYPTRSAALDWLPAHSLKVKIVQAGLHHDESLQAQFSAYEIACNLYATLRFGGEQASDNDTRRANQLTHHIHVLQAEIQTRLLLQDSRHDGSANLAMSLPRA